MSRFGGHGDGKGGSEGDKKTPLPLQDSGKSGGGKHGDDKGGQPQGIGKAN
jgi:hypothetical protein